MANVKRLAKMEEVADTGEELSKILKWKKWEHDNSITPYITPWKMNNIILLLGSMNHTTNA